MEPILKNFKWLITGQKLLPDIENLLVVDHSNKPLGLRPRRVAQESCSSQPPSKALDFTVFHPCLLSRP